MNKDLYNLCRLHQYFKREDGRNAYKDYVAWIPIKYVKGDKIKIKNKDGIYEEWIIVNASTKDPISEELANEQSQLYKKYRNFTFAGRPSYKAKKRHMRPM